MRPIERNIFFVDDEPGVRKAAARTLKGVGYKVACFAGAAECLKKLRLKGCVLLITDVKMPGIDGIELVRRARQIAPWVSALVITGYGDISTAVRAMKAGAFDFIEKPLQRENFLSIVKSAMEQNGSAGPSKRGMLLSKMEKIVLRLIMQGLSNKEMADILHRSRRTIEDHRLHIMEKFGADSTVEMVKRAASMGLGQSPSGPK
jgi:two-component system response regulator FixJ